MAQVSDEERTVLHSYGFPDGQIAKMTAAQVKAELDGPGDMIPWNATLVDGVMVRRPSPIERQILRKAGHSDSGISLMTPAARDTLVHQIIEADLFRGPIRQQHTILEKWVGRSWGDGFGIGYMVGIFMTLITMWWYHPPHF